MSAYRISFHHQLRDNRWLVVDGGLNEHEATDKRGQPFTYETALARADELNARVFAKEQGVDLTSTARAVRSTHPSRQGSQAVASGHERPRRRRRRVQRPSAAAGDNPQSTEDLGAAASPPSTSVRQVSIQAGAVLGAALHAAGWYVDGDGDLCNPDGQQAGRSEFQLAVGEAADDELGTEGPIAGYLTRTYNNADANPATGYGFGREPGYERHWKRTIRYARRKIEELT